MQQSKITIVALDGVIIGDFYYRLFFYIIQFSIIKIVFKNKNAGGSIKTEAKNRPGVNVSVPRHSEKRQHKKTH